jgi:hypothetical protein
MFGFFQTMRNESVAAIVRFCNPAAGIRPPLKNATPLALG